MLKQLNDDRLQVVSFCIILYTHNTMLMRSARLVQVLQDLIVDVIAFSCKRQLDTIPECDGQTNRQTDGHQADISIVAIPALA